MLKECATAEVRGLVVNAETRAPINGAKLTGDGGSGLSATTGADGRFVITGIKMKSNNTPWSVKLTAAATGFVSQTRTINVFCGARIDVGFGSLPASPAVLTGTVTGPCQRRAARRRVRRHRFRRRDAHRGRRHLPHRGGADQRRRHAGGVGRLGDALTSVTPTSRAA